MRAVLHGGWVDYVVYMGMTERYPDWFQNEVLDDIFMDVNRYTLWVPKEERSVDYHEKTLVEDYSVFLRKPDGEIMCTTQYVFMQLYYVFIYDGYSNHGIAAFEEDCIEYVECQPGVLTAKYPDWFYEYFTEAVHFPQERESVFIYDLDTTQAPVTSSSIDIVEPLDSSVGQVAVDTHCVFLKNLHGEIRHMEYSDFLKHYHPGPVGGHIYGS